MSIKQLSVFVENKPGRLAEITDVIGNAGIDIRALTVADTTEFGILRLIVSEPERAYEVLQGGGYTSTLTDVLAIGFDDVPGAFAKTIRVLSEAQISVEYMYAFISRTNDKAYVILKIEDMERAAAACSQNGISILTEDEVYQR